MNRLMIIAMGACLISGTAAAADAVSITVLKSERITPRYTDVLLQAQNASDQRLDTWYSCVFFNGETPEFESKRKIQNVPPHGKAISQTTFSYVGPFDKIECRSVHSDLAD